MRSRSNQTGDWLSRLRHELMGPLVNLRLGLEVLRESCHASACEAVIPRLEREIQREQHLVRSVCDILRLQQINKTAARLDSVIREAVLTVSCPIGVTIELDLESGLIVEIDPDLQLRLYVQLLENAITAINDKGIITIRARRLEEEQKGCMVQVDDSGVGIPPGKEEEIFSPFVSFFGTRSEMNLPGLGLFVCLLITQAHNGEIKAQRLPAGGSRITVFYPVHVP